MIKPTFTFLGNKILKKVILLLQIFFLTITISAQPSEINITGCTGTLNDLAYNGNYVKTNTTVCATCDSYAQVGNPSRIIYRADFGLGFWSGTTGSVNCLAVDYLVLSNETDCDPSNMGTSSPNGCVVGVGLPVELIDFKAEIRNDNIHLKWSTASETNNEGFEIERSTDGRSFDFISFVEGQGTSTLITDYTYKDNEVKEGQTYYYRLRQVDFDGSFTYSKVIAANLDIDETVAGEFYPNPTLGATTIDFISHKNDQWNIEAYSLSGQIVWQSSYQLTEGVNSLKLDFSEFGTGLYFVKFENNTRIIYRKLSVNDQP